MPCEICGRTVQNLGTRADSTRTFWCPSCGSILEESGNTPGMTHRSTEAPLWTRLLVKGDTDTLFRDLLDSVKSLTAADLKGFPRGQVHTVEEAR